MELINESNPVYSGKKTDQLNIEMSHTVSGNPARFNYGEVKIAEDRKWQNKLPRLEKLLIGLLTLPMMIKYNYKLIK